MAFRTNKTPVLQTKSASGEVASFNTALAMPLSSCNIAVNAWQEGSGDPYPAGGSAQQWGEEWELGIYKSANGEPSSSNSNIRSKSTNYISVTPNTTYYFNTNGYTMNVYQYASDKSYIGFFSVTNQSRQVDVNCYYLRFYIWSDYGATYKNDISINYPATDTAYHPYSNIRPIHGFSEVNLTANNVIHTIQLGQEVYGAEVDVVNGVAHCTHKKIKFSNVDSWAYATSGEVFVGTISDMKTYGDTGLLPSWVCDHYRITTTKLMTDWKSAINNLSFSARASNLKNIIVKDSQYEGVVSDFIAASENYELVYELDTPFDIQLTPTQIETLIGNNTIFADTGDVDLTYKDLDIAKRGNFREVFKLPS